MFEGSSDYPCAVSNGDDEGLTAAYSWSTARRGPGDRLTLFIPLKSSLRNSGLLQRWATYAHVDVVTSRGMGFVRSRGPVIAVWPDADDLGKIARSSGRVTALCAAAWNHDWLMPWIAASGAEVLGDAGEWANVAPMTLDPVVEEALKALTLTVNQSNTIAAGFEKDQVVGLLLLLNGSGYDLDAEKLQGWALAHGWRGKNPQQLADYVTDIRRGKRPRVRSMPNPDYLAYLKSRAADRQPDDE